MYNTSEEEIDKCFTDTKGKPLVHNDEPMNEGNYGGMVYDECMSKVGNYLGNLVVFPKKKDMTMKNISHEAFHVLSSMNDACDLERFKGVYARIRNVMELLYPVSIDNNVFSECKDKFNLGFEIIGLKILDCHRADEALSKACKLNGVNITPDGSEKKNPIVNTGTPWNEAQIRALTIGFPDSPTKEVAHIVGRSVYEVNKKAKELGLKKSPKYLKAIRTANLKKKTK